MIAHYGYIDGSGEYYIIIDSDKCNGCGECVKKCPQTALEMVTEMIDLEDKTVVAVSEQHRKKIKYTCATCNTKKNEIPCVQVCKQQAIKCVWKPL